MTYLEEIKMYNGENVTREIDLLPEEKELQGLMRRAVEEKGC